MTSEGKGALKLEPVNENFTIQVRDDGVFLTVNSLETSEQRPEVGQVLDALAERGVTNFERAKIEGVIRDQNGQPVKIADIVKNKGKADISIMVSRDRMEAFLQIELPEGVAKPEMDTVMNRMREVGVQHGVLTDAVALAIRQPGLRVLCAKGTPAENGIDAKIEVLVDQSQKGRPVELEDGSVDFKNIGMYTDVEKGRVIAQKTPATSGVPGSDVLGNPVQPKHGKDYPLQPGTNLQVVDGVRLVATTGGNLIINNGKMAVSPVLQIASDVDLATGNIDFSGDVVIRGSVQEGFSVKAGGNVDIAGIVSGGCVEGINVTVRLGILGLNKGIIKATGSVMAKFIENATVEAEQDILVNDVVLHSHLSAGKKIRVEGKRGQIVGGIAAAGEEIVVKSAGTTSTIATELQAGVNPKLREEYLGLRKGIKPMEESLDQLQKGLIKLRSVDQSLLPPEKKDLLLKLTRAQFNTMGQVESMRKRLCELETAYEELKGGQVRISDHVYPGVKIVIGSLVKPVQEVVRYITYYADGGEIKIRPFK